MMSKLSPTVTKKCSVGGNLDTTRVAVIVWAAFFYNKYSIPLRMSKGIKRQHRCHKVLCIRIFKTQTKIGVESDQLRQVVKYKLSGKLRGNLKPCSHKEVIK